MLQGCETGVEGCWRGVGRVFEGCRWGVAEVVGDVKSYKDVGEVLTRCWRDVGGKLERFWRGAACLYKGLLQPD